MQGNEDKTKQIQLSEADAHAIDAALGEAESQSNERTDRAQCLLALIETCPTENPPLDMAERTLAALAELQRRERIAANVQSEVIPAVPFRFGELVAMVAVMAIGACVVFPILDSTRTNAREVACRSHLGNTGQAMTRYAADNDNELPRGDVDANGRWYRVGHANESNTANLYRLVKNQYVSANDLSCPENRHQVENLTHNMEDWPNAKAVSYSYQNQFSERPTKLRQAEDARMVLLADKNPHFLIDDAGNFHFQKLDDETNSDMHQGRGQNVLYADGAAFWIDKPVLPNGDVIYKAEGINDYKGTEVPTSATDSFNVP